MIYDMTIDEQTNVFILLQTQTIRHRNMDTYTGTMFYRTQKREVELLERDCSLENATVCDKNTFILEALNPETQ